jgi:hypothetical protein
MQQACTQIIFQYFQCRYILSPHLGKGQASGSPCHIPVIVVFIHRQLDSCTYISDGIGILLLLKFGHSGIFADIHRMVHI